MEGGRRGEDEVGRGFVFESTRLLELRLMRVRGRDEVSIGASSPYLELVRMHIVEVGYTCFECERGKKSGMTVDTYIRGDKRQDCMLYSLVRNKSGLLPRYVPGRKEAVIAVQLFFGLDKACNGAFKVIFAQSEGQ